MKFHFDIIGKLPNKLYLACSGGMDSMVFYHFLLQGKRDIICLYFNHGTFHGRHAESFLRAAVGPLKCGNITSEMPVGCSKEDFWRKCRYEFFSKFNDRPIITCHHLNDQMETFYQGLAHGDLGRLIPYKRGGGSLGPLYIRPFLNVPKSLIKMYADRHSVNYIDDPSNLNFDFTRNRIRHKVIPELLKVNPGLFKSFTKLCNDCYYGKANIKS